MKQQVTLNLDRAQIHFLRTRFNLPRAGAKRLARLALLQMVSEGAQMEMSESYAVEADVDLRNSEARLQHMGIE